MIRLRTRMSLSAALLVLAVGGCASSATTSGAAGNPAPSTALSASPTPSGDCAWGPSGAPPGSPTTGTPPVAPPHTGTATMTIVTNSGDIVIKMDRAATPCTVASFAFLGDAKFFDNTPCHRLTSQGIFVLQCGDPSGLGTGGPSYTIPDENLPTGGSQESTNYARGTVAMANTGQPNTGGSQFFLVYKDSPLPPSYTKFGTITKGLDVLDKIAAAGAQDGAPDGPPKQPVQIRSLTVKSD